jgi:Zn-dependent protease
MISPDAKYALIDGILLIPALAMTITIRGFGRALAAKIAGDTTAQREGFLTLNPAAHVDTTATIIVAAMFAAINLLIPVQFISMMALFATLILFGPRWIFWVPIDPLNFKSPTRGPLIVGVAGIISSCVGALVSMYFIRLTEIFHAPVLVAEPLVLFLHNLFYFCLWFAVLHMLPLPSLDGETLLSHFWPKASDYLDRISPIGMLLLVILLLPVLRLVIQLLAGLLSLLVFI